MAAPVFGKTLEPLTVNRHPNSISGRRSRSTMRNSYGNINSLVLEVAVLRFLGNQTRAGSLGYGDGGLRCLDSDGEDSLRR